MFERLSLVQDLLLHEECPDCATREQRQAALKSVLRERENEHQELLERRKQCLHSRRYHGIVGALLASRAPWNVVARVSAAARKRRAAAHAKRALSLAFAVADQIVALRRGEIPAAKRKLSA